MHNQKEIKQKVTELSSLNRPPFHQKI